MTLKVVQIRGSNYRQVVPTLRNIADEIERGDYGDVESCGVVISGSKLSVFGMGENSDVNTIAVLLHAGFDYLVSIQFGPKP